MNEIKCPTCDKSFDSIRSLGPHRRLAHGYRVSDGKDNPKRAALGRHRNPAFKKHKGTFPCPQCDFVAQWRGGLKNHLRTHRTEERTELAKANQNAIVPTQPNGRNTAAPTQNDGDHRLQAAATFAAGRVAQLLESVALQHDLPPKSLAALVLRTVHATTLR
jgi:uncharacterized C2H2 Zn-finger protein/uncharacterized Zn finger protein (UPF0148 family)